MTKFQLFSFFLAILSDQLLWTHGFLLLTNNNKCSSIVGLKQASASGRGANPKSNACSLHPVFSNIMEHGSQIAHFKRATFTTFSLNSTPQTNELDSSNKDAYLNSTILSDNMKTEENEMDQNSESEHVMTALLSVQNGDGNLTEPSAISTAANVVSTATVQTTSQFRTQAYVLTTSALIGVGSGLCIALFKLLIEETRTLLYGTSFAEHFPVFLIPALGGLAVAAIAATGEFSAGLRGTVQEVDNDSLLLVSRLQSNGDNGVSTLSEDSDRISNSTFALKSLRKALAASSTLGTGNSLGPEGPSVEVGMSVSRLCMVDKPPAFLFGEDDLDGASKIRLRRLFLSCGAAAGVASGFNAPIAGVFFAFEIVQKMLPPLKVAVENVQVNGPSSVRVRGESLTSESGFITAILLSAVISALVSQVFLGNHLALSLSSYELKTPLVELPLYLLLGAISGVVAALFSGCAQFFKAFFEGSFGPVTLRDTMQSLPPWSKPIMGGVICGCVGIYYPQILFFGYETLNNLLANNSLSTTLLLSLLVVKTVTTAVCAGSGLVGGTFAPSLFLGGMVGASFHNIVTDLIQFVTIDAIPKSQLFALADVPAYAMVGAASVLAALFRAPITASLLLFELTRDYDVILPLMASAGVGSLVGDIVEKIMEEKRRDADAVSWGDLADRPVEQSRSR